MAYLKIGDVDFSGIVSGLKLGYQVLLSDTSGRNARGDNYVDIVNRKQKLSVTFRPTTQAEMASLLTAIQPYVVSVTYLDGETQALKTIQAYPSTAEPAYSRIIDGDTRFQTLTLSLVEM